MERRKITNLLLAFVLATSLVYSQGIIKGKVIDRDTRKPLPRTSVVIKGNLAGTSTNEKGEFTLRSAQKACEILFSHVGYETRKMAYRSTGGEQYFTILLKCEPQSLTGTIILDNSILDVAQERKTPVAVSTIGQNEILDRLANRDLPMVLKRTPSVYATQMGGGFGDASINIRGFSQENIAVMVNGVPINDMENGRVYWNNWIGLTDLTSALQVQRGLGASKLAIPSVGGTINIITRSCFHKKGGAVTAVVGNDGQNKSLVAYNTGKLENGVSASLLFSRSIGSKYIDGSQYEGYSYFVSLGYEPTKEHKFQFMLTGAPQWHDERRSYISIAKALKYGSEGKPNRRYNLDMGYLNGKPYNIHHNAYHKPIMSLSWDWDISEKTKLNTTAYASFGRGYGTQPYGGVNGKELPAFRNPQTGMYDLDAVVSENKASTPDDGSLVLAGRVNSHDWTGILTNFKHKISEDFSLCTGFDGRFYKGYHYVILKDLWGASAYKDVSNKNRLVLENYVSQTTAKKISFNPFGDRIENIDNTIGYNNQGNVSWVGFFGQLEYDYDDFSAFIEGAISDKGYQRVDNFLLDGTFFRGTTNPMHTKTDYVHMLGYTLKTGVNKVIENHNIFSNIGYYERQPDFNSVFRGDVNYVSDKNTNEKILGIELGYGYKSHRFNSKVNLYRTTWKDRFLRRNNLRDIDLDETLYYAEISGLNEVHQGIELEATYLYNEYLTLKAMFSYGDWYYQGNADALTYKTLNNRPYLLVDESSNRLSLLLDKAKVGGAARMTSNVCAIITPVQNLDIQLDWNYIDQLYANFDVYAFKNKENATKGVLRLPSYSLFDVGLTYRVPMFKSHRMVFGLNIYNALDTFYIAQSQDNIHPNEGSKLYKNIDVNNRVFFGFGRTWNFSMRYTF